MRPSGSWALRGEAIGAHSLCSVASSVPYMLSIPSDMHVFLPTGSSVILWRLSRPRQSTQDWQGQTCCQGSSWQWASINTARLYCNSGNCLLYLSHFFHSSFSLLTIIQLFFLLYISSWALLPSAHPDGFCSTKLFTFLHWGMAQTLCVTLLGFILWRYDLEPRPEIK